jgi:hypothetical protein
MPMINESTTRYRPRLLARAGGWIQLLGIVGVLALGLWWIWIPTPRFIIRAAMVTVFYVCFLAPLAVLLVANWFYSQISVIVDSAKGLVIRGPWLRVSLAQAEIVGVRGPTYDFWWRGTYVTLETRRGRYLLFVEGQRRGLYSDEGASLLTVLKSAYRLCPVEGGVRLRPGTMWALMVIESWKQRRRAA